MFSYAPNKVVNSPSSTRGRGKPPLFSTCVYRKAVSLDSGSDIDALFTRSVHVTSPKAEDSLDNVLTRSLHLPSSHTVGQQMYKTSSQRSLTSKNIMEETKKIESYQLNIGNPNMQRKSISTSKKSNFSKKIRMKKSGATPDSKTSSLNSTSSAQTNVSGKTSKESDLECSCKQYHSHVLMEDSINTELLRQEEQRVKAVTDSHRSSLYLAEGNDDPRNIFWTPALSFHSYIHGDSCVDFASLWPSKSELKEHLQNSGILTTVLRGAVLDLGLQAIVCGPLHLLECIIELCLIRADQQFENGSSMLHLACLARNVESVQYLTQIGISPKIRDKHGYTADQVTICPKVKRLLPPKYIQKDSTVLSSRLQVRPSLQDKDTIFSLAKNPKNFDDIQKKLQTFDFNVNTECDKTGNFLLHIACKEGLSQLPFIMALVKIQHADVELCNGSGMTPLMLAAIAGNSVLCDVLMCLFGASPNKSNPNNGRYALHYAVEGNHRKTVECLIRRGADVNIEDHEGRRPDDVPACIGPDDCKEVINFNRMKRLESLSQVIKKGNLGYNELRYTDMFVVDNDGYTLVMIAALHNQPEILTKLLDTNKSTINAQHCSSGMTALAISAEAGNRKCVQVLLEFGSNPTINDMQGYFPIHHAVLKNHEGVVDTILEFFPVAYVGLYKAIRMSKKSSIHVKLKSAWNKRQDEIVTPTLLSCSFNGDAEQLYVLLDEGDCINPKSGSGNWPLCLAVENGHLDVVKLLHQNGGDIKKRHGTTGSTVLHIGAKTGGSEIMEYLVQFTKTNSIEDRVHSSSCVKRKIDINAVDAENKTALQIAAERGFSRIVQLLIHYGSTTAILDTQGALFTAWEYEGVRILIDYHRELHTKEIMQLLSDKSKKAVQQLQKIWLPRFDHNLRNKQGDTPLMVACQFGRLPTVKFLLESAVYSSTTIDSDSEDDSDTDSGVLDHTWTTKLKKKKIISEEGEDVSQISATFNQSLEVCTGVGGATSEEFSQSVEIRNDGNPFESGREKDTLQVLLRDIDKPKGLQIFHDGFISHVCAVNIYNGHTALHRTIEGGDNLPILTALLEADASCINVQDVDGLTPLHLACKYGRKKSVELLLSYEGIDLNTRTLQGQLPEEMTRNKAVIKLIQKSRLNQNGFMKPPSTPEIESPDGSKAPSIVGSTINFDKVHNKYEELKKESKTS